MIYFNQNQKNASGPKNNTNIHTKLNEKIAELN